VRLTRGLLTRAVVFCIWGRANTNQPRSIIRAYASIYPREDEASAEILHEVRQEGLSYVALVETLRSHELAFCGLEICETPSDNCSRAQDRAAPNCDGKRVQDLRLPARCGESRSWKRPL
jgi:hypothetical protein